MIIINIYLTTARSAARSARSLLRALAAVVTMLADFSSAPGLSYKPVTISLRAFTHSAPASSTSRTARSVRPALRPALAALANLVSLLSQNSLSLPCYTSINTALH